MEAHSDQMKEASCVLPARRLPQHLGWASPYYNWTEHYLPIFLDGIRYGRYNCRPPRFDERIALAFLIVFYRWCRNQTHPTSTGDARPGYGVALPQRFYKKLCGRIMGRRKAGALLASCCSR